MRFPPFLFGAMPGRVQHERRRHFTGPGAVHTLMRPMEIRMPRNGAVAHKRQKSPNTVMAELVHAAIESIAEANLRGAFVTTERIKRRKNFGPTEFQMKLYTFIKRRGWIPREWTLGMHWGMLGGLMARGKVVPEIRDGKEGVAVRD